MTNDRWNQVVDIFSAVAARSPDHQQAHLGEACADDPDLRTQVEELLANHAIAETEGFLEPPPWVIDEIPVLLPDFEEYKRIEYIGHGGMGVVYKAFDESLDTHVALKMSLPRRLTTAEDISRFRIDPQSMAKLKHPNIVQVNKVGECDGKPYFTMNLIERKDGSVSLEKHLARFQDDPNAAARLMVKVARAVEQAHQRGILHRDLKPGNILLDEEDNPRLTDFGLAKQIGKDARLTDTGEPLNTASVAYRGVVGTVMYMSPEQADPSPHREVTTLSDVYGLGATLYALLTGRSPFRADTLKETLQLVRAPEQKPIPPRELNPRVDRTLEAICLKCLDKDPVQRYRSAEGLAQNLRLWLGHGVVDPPQPPWLRFWNLCRRNPLGASLAATAALLLIAVTTALILRGEVQRTRCDMFVGCVQTQSHKIRGRFSRYEKLLEQLRGSAVVHLARVEPDADEPVSYANTLKGPDYEKPAVVIAPAATVEPKTLHRLMLLHNDFERTKVRSSRLLTDEPLVWVYVALEEGVDCTYPGMDGFPDDYDPRDRPWYQAAKNSHGEVVWVSPYADILGQGRVISCSAPIHDYENSFMGVTGFDLLEDFVISDILKIIEQPHLDAFLVDGRGEVLIPDEPRKLTIEVVERIQEGESGHVRTDDKLVAYFPLHVSDWYYVVVADLDDIQEVLNYFAGQ